MDVTAAGDLGLPYQTGFAQVLTNPRKGDEPGSEEALSVGTVPSQEEDYCMDVVVARGGVQPEHGAIPDLVSPIIMALLG